MSYWDSFSKKASETTAKAVKKAKDLAEVTKISSEISDEEKSIDNLYYQIGKQYVSLHKNDCEPSFCGFIASIGESEERIAAYKLEIQEVKGVRRCEKCGAEVPNNAGFCNSCGAPMPAYSPSANSTDLLKCEKCGEMVKKGMNFCTSCGAPMNTGSLTEEAIVTASENADETEQNKCPVCGAELEDGSGYCTECGTKI